MSWIRAKEYFDKAIQKDPTYAPAYAGLAELYMRPRGSPTKVLSDHRSEARRWAEMALKLDETVAQAHVALARASQQEWAWAGAEREYRRAIELNPSYARARMWYAMYLYGIRRFEQAVEEAKRAQQLDPGSPFVNTWAGAAYIFAGRTQEGMASLQKALELDPRYTDANLVRARTYIAASAYRAAIAELQGAVTLSQDPLLLGALAHAYARAGQREQGLKLVAELERMDREADEFVAPFGLVYAYAGFGQNDQAFALIERDFAMRTHRMTWLDVDPLLEPLRSDPRFGDLVRRMGLPPALNDPDTLP
jgi:serine/threonine-protein kinase